MIGLWTAKRRQALRACAQDKPAVVQSYRPAENFHWPFCLLVVFCLLIDGAEQHAASAADFHLSGFGGEGYYSNGIGAPRVGDFYAV